MELICHHTYDTWSGLPVDRSIYGLSNGEAVGATYRPDGATPGSGALDLGVVSGHRVAVPPSEAWTKLGAVEAQVRIFIDGVVAGAALQRVLIDAHDCFQLRLTGRITGGGDQFLRLSVRIQDPDQPDGYASLSALAVRFGVWTTVGFRYDGVHTLELLVDGDVVAQSVIGSPLRPVGAGGVSIGAPLTGTVANLPLVLDELQVWRRDPQEMHRTFATRPLPAGAADCWARAYAQILAKWDADPQAAARQFDTIEKILTYLRRRLAASGATAEWQALHERYVELWSGGRIDSDDMEDLFGQGFAWWRDHGGRPDEDPDFLGLIGTLDPPDGVDLSCDPQLTAFLERVERAGRASA